MKYVLVIGDGMADFPVEELSGKTPLQVAKKPVIDRLAGQGLVGEVRTVPRGVPAGSDTAILNIFGYDPRLVYTGRSPLEAAGSGVKMEKGNISFRCNLAAITEDGDEYEGQTMLSHSGGAIDGQDAMQLMNDLIAEPSFAALLEKHGMSFTVNPSYRHIAVLKTGSDKVGTTPPHDILTRPIAQYLPKGEGDKMLREIMSASWRILKKHPINNERRAAGKMPANSLWFWGAGTKPSLQNFTEKTGLKGAMVSAVDLLKGIAVGAGMKAYQVPGATGSIDANFEGKAQAAIDALTKDDCDFVYVHVEAPDEMGHQGLLKEKIQSIEYLDRRLIAPVKKAMEDAGEDFRMLVLPDHPTPIRLRTHTGDPVPYVLYDSTRQRKSIRKYTEAEAEAAGNFEPNGYRLIERLLSKPV